MWNIYEKDGRVIEATELAYRVIYAAQGYKPKTEPPAKEAESDDEGGSDTGSRGKGEAARRRKSWRSRSKSS